MMDEVPDLARGRKYQGLLTAGPCCIIAKVSRVLAPPGRLFSRATGPESTLEDLQMFKRRIGRGLVPSDDAGST